VTRRKQKHERTVAIPVVRLPHADGLDLAAYQSTGAAGLDLLAAIDGRKPLRLEPGARMLVPTGLRLALPPGLEGQVRPRSGLALQHGITVLNSPGTIDCDYRGEVKVLLVNLGTSPYCIVRGARIAQLVLQRYVRARLVESERIACTERGAAGFGSTGAGGARAERPRTGTSRKRRR
jgi:dUTP pyrophosphatase